MFEKEEEKDGCNSHNKKEDTRMYEEKKRGDNRNSMENDTQYFYC